MEHAPSYRISNIAVIVLVGDKLLVLGAFLLARDTTFATKASKKMVAGSSGMVTVATRIEEAI